MTSKAPETGDVICLTEFYPLGTKDFEVTRGTPIWALVTDTTYVRGGEIDYDALYLLGGADHAAHPDGLEEYDWRADAKRSSSLYVNDGDTWTIVPPEKWPDEVTVAVAKYKLSGDSEC